MYTVHDIVYLCISTLSRSYNLISVRAHSHGKSSQPLPTHQDLQVTIKTQLLSLVPLLYSTGVSITNWVFRFPLLYECKISKSDIWFILKKFVKHMEFFWFPCFEHQFSSTKILRSWGSGPVKSGGRECWSSTESESLGTSYHGFDVAPWLQGVDRFVWFLWVFVVVVFFIVVYVFLPLMVSQSPILQANIIPLVRCTPPPPLLQTWLRWADTEQHWTVY